MKKITLIITLFLVPFSFVAQWNPDITVNTSVSGRLTNREKHVTTPSGKTFIAYGHFENGVDYLYLQLLDLDGNKMFGNDGVLLDQVSVDWTSNSLFIQVDDQENCYISSWYSINETRLYGVNNSGETILSEMVVSDEAIYAFELSENNNLVFMMESHLKKYTNEGILIWDKDLTEFPELAIQSILAGEIRFDNSGNFYALMGISMSGFGNAGYTNYFIQKFNTNGEPLWNNLIPVNLDQSFMTYSPGMFLYPAKIEVVDLDVLVTIPLWNSSSSCMLYGQRFASLNGQRLWNEDLLPMAEVTEYNSTICTHEKYYNETSKELYLSITVTENNPNPNAPKRNSVLFQRIDVQNGNRLNAISGSVIASLSEDLPISTTIEMCNDEIVLDVLTRLFNELTLTGTNTITLLKINESGDILSSIPIKTTPTRVMYGFSFSGLFNIDASGQAIVVFVDNRSPNPQEYNLFAQNARICINTSDIDEQRLVNTKVYPNPAQNILCFEFDNEVSRIEIISLDGKSMFQSEVEDEKMKLDVSNWTDGVYLYTVVSQKGNRSNGKFIKD